MTFDGRYCSVRNKRRVSFSSRNWPSGPACSNIPVASVSVGVPMPRSSRCTIPIMSASMTSFSGDWASRKSSIPAPLIMSTPASPPTSAVMPLSRPACASTILASVAPR